MGYEPSNPVYIEKPRAPLDEAIFATVLKRRNSHEIITLYVIEAVELLATLSVAIEHGEPAMVQQAAHSLKGSSRYLGANLVASLSAELEQAGRTETLTGETAIQMAQLEREFERTRRALLAHVGGSV